MPSVAFVSPKGGAGKTTASLLLALELCARGQRVAMIDSDPNKPLMHWAGLRPPAFPAGSGKISVHPAPTLEDIPAAQREIRRLEPDWTILDTEGSVRGAIAFSKVRPNLVLTPLAGSMLEALQAVKAAQMLTEYGGRSDRAPLHRCLLTRLPATTQPIGVKPVVDELHKRGLKFLETPLFEHEAYRALFSIGGGFEDLEAEGVAGVAAARANAAGYVDAVVRALEAKG
jgi:chromosome partitioning protein